MKQVFALDLKVLRRKSGLTQRDCAHLLAVHPSKVSLIECGKSFPSIGNIAVLTVIYGRSFEQLCEHFIIEAHRQLYDRVRTMPRAPKRWLGRFNRQHTLDQLADRLAALTDYGYAAA